MGRQQCETVVQEMTVRDSGWRQHKKVYGDIGGASVTNETVEQDSRARQQREATEQDSKWQRKIAVQEGEASVW